MDIQQTLFAVLLLLYNSRALDLESAHEQNCFPIKKTANVDFQWMMSVKEWYYPVMNRLDLYLTSLEIHGSTDDPTKLSESQVYYDSCVKAKFVGTVAHATGFNGRSSPFAFGLPTATEDGLTYQTVSMESGLSGSTYTTLTDNSTYCVMVVCWDDKKISWGAISTVLSYPKKL